MNFLSSRFPSEQILAVDQLLYLPGTESCVRVSLTDESGFALTSIRRHLLPCMLMYHARAENRFKRRVFVDCKNSLVICGYTEKVFTCSGSFEITVFDGIAN